MEKYPLSSVEKDEMMSAHHERLRLYESFFHHTDLSIIYLTVKGAIININHAAERLFGYRNSEITGHTPEHLLDMQQIEANLPAVNNNELFNDGPFRRLLHEARAASHRCKFETSAISKSQSRLPVSLTITSLWDRDNLTGYVMWCHEIGERQKAEREISLRQSEEKFRLLTESIPGVVFMMNNDAPHSMSYVNNKIEEVTGYAVHEFYDGHIELADLIHDDDRVYVANLRNQSLDDLLSYTIEYRIRHRDGTWRWISETGIGVKSGETKMLEGFLADITQRMGSEQELRRMADENSRVFNNSITLTAIAGFDGYYKKLNPAWEKTLGWSRDELLTQPINSFIHPDDIAKTEEVLRVILTGHTVTMFENRYLCKDGSYRWLLWGSSPDIAKKIIYASAIDITSRKKFEEELIISKRNLEVAAYELEEQNRHLDEFAHIISHNLRAPVANIKALLSFITETSQLGDYQLIFEKIGNVTHNISETMNELMEMIKIRKTHEIERVEIRFKDVLDKVVQSLEGDLIEAGATVTYNFNNAPKIYYSKPYLESILQNLISNAIKYRSPKRIAEIYVSTDLVMSGIELRVKDNGLGIDLDRFGNNLFGLHKTFHENKEARGVGLFLTKTQVETLGGTIRAESKVDSGTTFIVQF